MPSPETPQKKEPANITPPVERIANALGPDLMDAFADDDITEIYVNSHEDHIRFDTHSEGKVVSGISLRKGKISQFLSLVGTWSGIEAGEKVPSISTELPLPLFNRARLQGMLPPVTLEPSFVIRKRPTRTYTLWSYVENGFMTRDQYNVIVSAIKKEYNILVAGGTGSGKTTLVNAVILKISEVAPRDRLIIIEDTREIQCSSPDRMQLCTSKRADHGLVDLVKDTLRLTPDRILVGECRDETALHMCDAWATGHPGGSCTVHANDALGALRRLDRLAQRESKRSQAPLIGEAVDTVVHIEGGNQGREVKSVTAVGGYSEENGYSLTLMA